MPMSKQNHVWPDNVSGACPIVISSPVVIGAFWSTLFVSVFQGSLLVIAQFQALVDQFSSYIFSDLSYSCFLKEYSNISLLPSYYSSSQFPLLFFSSLESFSVLFLPAKLGECVALWLTLTPPPLKWLMEQQNPFEVCKHAADTMNLAIKKYDKM